jgi:hypothetical protein
MRQIIAGDDEPLALFERYGSLPLTVVHAYRGDQFPPHLSLLRRVSST